MRHLILIAAALPIVTASMALANWARSDVAHRSYRNDVEIHNSTTLYQKHLQGLTHDSMTGIEKAPARLLSDACKTTAQRWQNQLDTDFHVVIETPFVVIGDLPAAQLKRHYTEVVVPTADAIRHTYSEAEIDEPVVLMLFATEESYRIHSRRLFAQQNASVYGYYKPSNRTVAINLESGLGTLVHELTHAIFDFDFANMPIWLNEGIASLHEQATFVGGNTNGDQTSSHSRIVGQVNWRYPIVKDAIDSGRLKSIEDLLADSAGFRGPRQGVNYAHARYLCMYLQKQNKLAALYKSLRDPIDDHAKANKPNDYDRRIFQAMFPGKSWQEIDHDFQQWAVSLE